MKTIQAAARWLMGAAITLAPADRSEWCAAMKAELEVLGDSRTALSWAWGAFGNALGWRFRVEAPFLVLLAIIPPLEDCVKGEAFFWLAHRLPASTLFGVLGAFEGVVLFVLTLGLTLLRPKLAVLSALVVAFVGPSGLICWPHVALSSNPMSHFQAALDLWVWLVWAQPDNPALNTPHLHNWQLLALVLWQRFGPCVYGAVVGWGVEGLMSRLGGRSRRTDFA